MCKTRRPFEPCIYMGMDSAKDRRRYNVTPSLIGWAHMADSQVYNIIDRSETILGKAHTT